MIRIENWVASIPEEDKHVAYMGEGMSETRTFFLTGEGWEQYKDWNFHLDMAFDLSSVTVRDSRQVVKTTTDSTQDSVKDVTGQVTGQSNRQQTTQTDGTSTRSEEDTITRTEQNTQSGDGSYALDQQVTESGEGTESGTTHSDSTLTEGGSTEQNSEQSTEGQVKTKTTVTRETYTADTKVVNWESTTDIAALEKTVEPDGIRLVWTVLRQQTQLPGRLRATLRAVGASYAQVKKSAMMIFEVEPAVTAYAAVDLPVSEFEQMEQRMDTLCEQARQHAVSAGESATSATADAAFVRQARNTVTVAMELVGSIADEVENNRIATERNAASASDSRQAAEQYASEAFDNRDAAAESALEAAGHAGDARTYMQQAETHRNTAVERALAAGMASVAAEEAAAQAQQAKEEAHAILDPARLLPAPGNLPANELVQVVDGVWTAVSVAEELAYNDHRPVSSHAVRVELMDNMATLMINVNDVTDRMDALERLLGDVEFALGNVIALQEMLIGGDGV